MTDLDREGLDAFVDAFYARLLADPLLAPLFLDVAAVDLERHLPRIKAYWRKMLFGDRSYTEHMMEKHRDLDRRSPLSAAQYAAWLSHFETTLRERHRGPLADRARELARRIAGNMRRNLESGRRFI